MTLESCGYLVLDEADQMLDMGFIHALKKIAKHIPQKRQTLLFSATMPKLIDDLAQTYLHNPIKVQVAPPGKPADKVTQAVHYIPQGDKAKLLETYLKEHPGEMALVFGRTKHGSEKLMKLLVSWGFSAGSIHGNKSQNQRERTLSEFREGKLDVLVATDVAARGIDIPGVRHVYNYDMPNVPENYVHRIGRTARAGADGRAVAFCAPAEMDEFKAIEKLLKKSIDVIGGAPWSAAVIAASPKPVQGRGGRPQGKPQGKPQGRAGANPVDAPPKSRFMPRAMPGVALAAPRPGKIAAPVANRHRAAIAPQRGASAQADTGKDKRRALARLFFQVQLHFQQDLLNGQRLAQQPLGLVDGNLAVANRLIVFRHQHPEPLRQRHHVGIDPAFVRIAPLGIIGQRDPPQIGQSRGDMRMPRSGLQRGHHIDRHEPICMFIRVGIIAPDRGFGFARQFACGFDAHILHKRFGVFLQIGCNRHDGLSTCPRQMTGEIDHFFPINRLAAICHS